MAVTTPEIASGSAMLAAFFQVEYDNLHVLRSLDQAGIRGASKTTVLHDQTWNGFWNRLSPQALQFCFRLQLNHCKYNRSYSLIRLLTGSLI